MAMAVAMETYIPASSPLYAITACTDCPPAQYLTNADGPAVLLPGGGSVSLNFTGTGLLLNHTISPVVEITYTVNNTAVTPIAASSVSDLANFTLPLGRHQLRIDIAIPANTPEADAYTFHDSTIDSGLRPTDSTTDVTIDDTAWRTGQVVLTEGWNMLETPFEGSNYIDTELVQAEQESLGSDWGGSVSFTQRAGSAVTILFEGQSVSAFGITGGQAGTYQVQLDGGEPETFDASFGPRSFGSLLYHATGLTDGNHTLTLTNMQDGRRLSFDRLVAVNGLSVAPEVLVSPSSSSTGTPTPSQTTSIDASSNWAMHYPTDSASSASDPHSSGAGHALPDIERGGPLSTSAIVGVSVAALAVVAMLAGLGYWFWVHRRQQEAQEKKAKRSTFFRWSDSHHEGRGGRAFARLHSPLGIRTTERGTEASRFPGLGIHRGHSKKHHKTNVARKNSFLDLTVETDQTRPRSSQMLAGAAERRILPINHATMGGDSPLTELVRYTPHETQGSTLPLSFGAHRGNTSISESYRTAGTGLILPLSQGRPSGPGGAL